MYFMICADIARDFVGERWITSVPRSLHPDLVYCWHNWVFSCHECNSAKSAKSPAGGYVNPCADWELSRPECHFSFDTFTGEIVVKLGLGAERHEKAQRTIDDLDLNDHHHLRWRQAILMALQMLIQHDTNSSYVAMFASRRAPFSSLSRVWLTERGHSVKRIG